VTSALLVALLAAGSPLSGEHPLSREAREKLATGDAAGALEAYAALERELGARPEIAMGRGAALAGLGRHAEARKAFAGAGEAPEPLGSRALLGAGNAAAGQGDLDGAVAAYRQSLARDPGHGDARHNLEVALRRRAEAGAPSPPPERPPEPGDDGPRRRGGGSPGGEAAPAPGEPRPRAEERGAGERPGEPAGPGPRPEREGEAGGEADGRMRREEAERLLDALRARERNLPPAAAGPREAGRRDAARDW
jgi:tetratricopeptide (TPR) repeat protein